MNYEAYYKLMSKKWLDTRPLEDLKELFNKSFSDIEWLKTLEEKYNDNNKKYIAIVKVNQILMKETILKKIKQK